MQTQATSIADHVTRIVLTEEAFLEHQHAHGLWRKYHWPAKWVAPEAELDRPIVWAARCRFRIEERHEPIRLHVSADERFELYLDGHLFARGPERGDSLNYFYQTYELTDLPVGDHLLTARVWAMGEAAPYAQLSFGTAFLLAAEGAWGETLNTGTATWETRRIEGIQTRDNPGVGPDGFTGKKLRFNAQQYPFGFEVDTSAGLQWTPARTLYAATTGVPTDRHSGRTLRAAMLPDMLRKPITAKVVRFAERVSDDTELTTHACLKQNVNEPLFGAVKDWLAVGAPLQVGPRTRLRIIIDLEDYYCAYPQLIASGGSGAELLLGWAESLYLKVEGQEKGDRSEIAGKFFRGYADEFILDGGRKRSLGTLWWQAGRYLQLVIKTAEDPLTLHALTLEETRYPLGQPRLPSIADESLAPAIRLSQRGIECCVHETFMDCPHYEQLQYVGDTRLEALVVMTWWDDDRPVRKAIELFDSSRLPSGWTQSRYPCRVSQVIPTFSMVWVGMVHDFARLRSDMDLVRARMPGVRAVMDACLSHVDQSTGLLSNPPGWNFMDWASGFPDGVPPAGSANGPCGSINWLFALSLRWWAELEEKVGDPELAGRARRWFKTVSSAADAAFWDETRGVWSEDLEHAHFSEHSQALAILVGTSSVDRCKRAVRALVEPKPEFSPATIYFMFYVIEALRQSGEDAAIDRRLDLWRALGATGLRTTPEQPEPTRSDCHGWGGHILYHFVQAELQSVKPR